MISSRLKPVYRISLKNGAYLCLEFNKILSSCSVSTFFSFAKDERELKKKYEELQMLKYNGITNLSDIKMKDFSQKWYDLNSASKEYNTLNVVKN